MRESPKSLPSGNASNVVHLPENTPKIGFEEWRETWSRQVNRNRKLAARCARVASALCWYLNRDSRDAFPGQRTLAEDAGMSRAQVRYAIEDLVAAGHLAVKVDPARRKSNIYKPKLVQNSAEMATRGGNHVGPRGGHHVGPRVGPTSGPEPSIEPPSEPPKDKDPPSAVRPRFFFQEGVIRLTEAEFKKWELAFPHIGVRAELTGMAAWAAKQSDWFQAAKSLLAKREREVKLKIDLADRGPKQPRMW